MSSERSLCDLNDEVIGNIVYFTPHIWDVLNFTATSRRLNTLSERHLKTMKYLDIRIPYLAESESAGIIEEGIRTLCLRRCGNQLTEITIMKPERWREDTEFIRSLQLLPHTLLKMIEGDEQLEDLRYQLFSNEDAIAKQRKITMSTLEMSILSVKVDKSDRSVITGLQRDFNAVKRLDIIFSKQEWEINLIAKCFPLFPNIEALGIQFEEGAYPKFGKFIIKLITLLSRIDNKVQVKIRHWLVLDFPAFFARLKDYLPRLQIYKSIGTERPLMYPGSGLKSYQEVETVLSDQFYSRYRQVFLQAVSRHKDITDLSHRAEEVICFHGEYTETLTLSLYHIEPLGKTATIQDHWRKLS
ncbi:hypothetical protein HDE_12824 [Halotydeus destructor]|nr:hypothetical protein HDE_12824 [Halotydeus destructor]